MAATAGGSSSDKRDGTNGDHAHEHYLESSPSSSDQQQSGGRPYYYVSPENMAPRPSPRRTKRLVPDTEKDVKYWEKRKRNNDAARRSRENKRRLDMDVRQRMLILEEELSLARKELAVIKMKFGLPLDQRFLSTDDNGEFIGTAIVPSELSVDHDDDGTYCPTPSQLAEEELSGRTLAPPGPPRGQPLGAGSHSLRQGPLPVPAHEQRSDSGGRGLADSPGPIVETIPMKKRKRGRKEWEEPPDESDVQENDSNDFYPRMLSNGPYPGMLWPNANPPGAQQGQYHFPAQIPMMSNAAAAYQAFVDDQQRLPSINAFSNLKEEMQQLAVAHQQHQQQHSQQQQLSQQQQQSQTQQQPPSQQQHPQHPDRASPIAHSRDDYVPNSFQGDGNNSSAATSAPGLPRGYYVPYSDNQHVGSGAGGGGGSGGDKRSLPIPADLSLAKPRVSEPGGHHLPSEQQRDANCSRQQNMGIVRPIIGAHSQMQQQQKQENHHHHQQQQQLQNQQQPQHHTPKHDSDLSGNSDEEEKQGRLQMENTDIRNRLQQLSAEVAKMKDFVLKDTIRTDA